MRWVTKGRQALPGHMLTTPRSRAALPTARSLGEKRWSQPWCHAVRWSGHASAREIADQLQRAKGKKEEAFGRNDFAALPGLHTEVERLTALLQEIERADQAERREREELERSQQDRLAQLRADAERTTRNTQAAVRDEL